MTHVQRLLDRPIIGPDLHPSLGLNIQGPSLIRVPDWIDAPLGRYYLYFADHKGKYVRLAYADHLLGPWRVHVPGTLHLADSHFLVEPPELTPEQGAVVEARAAARGSKISRDLREVTATHIASPDVHVDHARRQIRMYYHGLAGIGEQVTRLALSNDGLQFVANPEVLSRPYLRAFEWEGAHYGLAMPGQIYRSADGLTDFRPGPLLFNPDMRHAAVCIRDGVLSVFWTQVSEAPERILLSTIDLTPDWSQWRESAPLELLRPEREWEGANMPLDPSFRGTAYGQVNQLRDPAVFVEEERTLLLYAVAGESGIAIAEVHFD